MTKELVERLRQDVRAHELTGNGGMKRVQAMRKAADALEAKDARIAELEAENERLREGFSRLSKSDRALLECRRAAPARGQE